MTDAVNDDTARELAERIYHAVHLVPSDGSGLDRHCCWEVRTMMKQLNPYTDITGMEMMAIAVILAGANDRRLGRAPGGGGIPISVPEEIARPVFTLIADAG